MTNPSRPMTLAELHEAVRAELGSRPAFWIEVLVKDRGETKLYGSETKISVEWQVSIATGPYAAGPTPEAVLIDLRTKLDSHQSESLAQANERVGEVAL